MLLEQFLNFNFYIITEEYLLKSKKMPELTCDKIANDTDPTFHSGTYLLDG